MRQAARPPLPDDLEADLSRFGRSPWDRLGPPDIARVRAHLHTLEAALAEWGRAYDDMNRECETCAPFASRPRTDTLELQDLPLLVAVERRSANTAFTRFPCPGCGHVWYYFFEQEFGIDAMEMEEWIRPISFRGSLGDVLTALERWEAGGSGHWLGAAQRGLTDLLAWLESSAKE